MKIRLSDIIEKAKDRPVGYYEDVLASGSLDGDILTISPEAYGKLVEKYNPEMPKERIKGLGDVVYKLANPIARTLDKVFGTHIQGCGGCAKRREALNKAVPF